MPLAPLVIQPGIVTDVSDYSAGKANSWVSGQNIRFINGFPAKRGTSRNRSYACSAAEGIPRDMLIWQSNDGKSWIAVGTHQKLLIIEQGGIVCHEVTPAGLNIPESGVTYNAQTGYGTGEYGGGTWGTPRQISAAISSPTAWTFADWGEDLLANLRNGKIYYWDRSGGIARLVELNSLPGADRVPNVADTIILSMPDRHLIAGGVDPVDPADNDKNPMLLRWAHQESLTDWNPDATDTAGDQLLEYGTEIIGMLATRGQILVLTNYAAYLMVFVGAPYTFQVELVGTSCGAISKNSLIDVDGTAYWMGVNGFYLFDGSSVRELPCPVKYQILEDIEGSKTKFIFAAHNSEYNEIAWHYHSENDYTNADKYVVYNYAENWWSLGSSGISCWADTNGIFENPISFTGAGQMRDEELSDGNDLDCFIESAPIEMGAGNQLMYLSSVVPDFHDIRGNVEMTIKGRKYPSESREIIKSATLTNATRKSNLKMRARQMRLRLDADGRNYFHSGQFRIDVVEDGGR